MRGLIPGGLLVQKGDDDRYQALEAASGQRV